MKLTDLTKEIDAIAETGRLDAVVRDVTHDSRSCKPGSVFVAIRGAKFDGHQHIPQAVERGAICVISEREAMPEDAPAWIQVHDSRASLARAAAAAHGHPSRRLKLVGITGTNGKTTTAHLIDSIIRASEGSSAMFGTISHRIAGQEIDARNTTPEASDIQRMLARAVTVGCRSAVMEVSSHAIELHRADALNFTVAVFTNLTRDHLDYHSTMESYFAAKEKLFNGRLGAEPLLSVINADDEYGVKLLGTAKGRKITYGLVNGADVRTDEFELSPSGLAFVVRTPAGKIEIRSSLVGRPHVYNILAAVGAGLALGFGLDEIARGVAECRTVAGRFEQVLLEDSDQPPFTVIVDYAHTDDALKNVLRTAREIAGRERRVIAVFGCGGDRDRTKRAPMGEIAGSLSDVAIVTSDNPRSEDPAAIIADIEVGLNGTRRPYLRLPDRREAIFRAIAEAREGDVVVIAGKGHETYQVLRDNTIHFDDHEVAREAMMKRRGSHA
ncbi:MAG TPA: UDP-N-acetylmuramoyl-L-alanyl-D-glutamate--2,6-diaminopimelate ligase [Blastocatellia bacterium]|nr:UDP-N-acetylmuramoyl-L-alanyl-D-glutamate--2,6-diaminopimelate ligase [Blastocatellia bacterium]